MTPSHTVENYLKAILQAQTSLGSPDEKVPMGQLASGLGVVPGTATTMVKALAESGLVLYEPYGGVRLSTAGEKLATLVLRRHRLIELFLVQVMGMSWTEVHDEAETLEHAVSDRLIDRIDEMLGHPSVDPHGDPIPGPEGTVRREHYDTLLTCPLHTPVTVRRLSDQDSEFLRFVERNDLKPGQSVRVEARDDAADSVKLRAAGDREVTIGARAASKVLVSVARALILLAALASSARAQTPVPKEEKPFGIADNSFLVEEAFNQERGVFQNIFNVTRSGGHWGLTFTQEWPLGGMTHQFSYTLAFLDGGTHAGFGDTLINYRYQALTEGPGRPAFSPRLSLMVPTGQSADGLGDGSVGLQINLPFSKRVDDFYFHWNAGVTWLPRAGGNELGRDRADIWSPFLAGSSIFRLREMFHLMLESGVIFEQSFDGLSKTRDTLFVLSPGVRGGWNFGDRQLITGVATPVTWQAGDVDTAIFLYLSYELPFKR
jgi:DtxR family transcriptional regulator, Mn-dependent transcriptional regulator